MKTLICSHNCALTGNNILLFGSEGYGLKTHTEKYTDFSVKININNLADNVIPSKASAIFNIRYNDRHTSTSLRSKISKIIKKTAKKWGL